MSIQTKNSLTPQEAADYLGIAETTLRKSRMTGKRQNHISTPPYVRLGRAIRYLRDDLDSFLAAHRVAGSEKKGA